MAADSLAKANAVMLKSCDYILPKDDDDIWEPNHVANMEKYIKMYPLSGLITSKASYMTRKTYLPRTQEKNIYLNNYESKPKDSVRSSHVYRAHVYKEAIEVASHGNVNIPHDMRVLQAINNMHVPVLYIPETTVHKLSENKQGLGGMVVSNFRTNNTLN